MLNRCDFIGNLGADPEIRAFANGGKIANIRLAVSEKWKDRDGNKKEKTEWVSIVVSADGLVGVVERYLKKGSKIHVSGKLKTRKWQDQSGNDRYTTEVVVGFGGSLTMLDGPSGGTGGRSEGNQSSSHGGQGTWEGSGGGGGSRSQSSWDDLEDSDVPF